MPQKITPLVITAYTATTALGTGLGPLRDALAASRSGLRPNDFGEPAEQRLATWIGRVPGVEDAVLPPELAPWDCRNNRLAWMGLNADGFLAAALAARERYGADRVAVIVGTSTSSIGETERAYTMLGADGRFPEGMRSPDVHTPHAPGLFVQRALGLAGPCETISTACSSSAKVFASAERLIRLGLADAAVVGGADSLCGSVLFGFNSLELVSDEPCRPFDAERGGISLGEAAGFALLERHGTGPRLLGHGEASDAHHMSTPHPEGAGAERALDDALARAGLTTGDIDYINLHGTASSKNDEVEAALVARRFPARTHASSTKGFTGHTLGAAGIVEAAVSLLALQTGLMPGNLNARTLDAVCGPQIRREPATGRVRHVLSNSFGFGGNNCALIFGEAQDHDAATADGAAAPRTADGLPQLPTLYLEGPAFWHPQLPGWDAARAAFRGEAGLAEAPARRPAPQILAPAERRRAPDTVALALEVASAAIAGAGRAAVDLPCVFTSAQGDLAINDYMCTTLAQAPTQLSPIKFHNSVHNAAVGYWTIGTGCQQASNAISAALHSFAAGLLEAATECAADRQPVLLVGFDAAANGPLAQVHDTHGLLAGAVVIAPERSERTVATLTLALQPGAPAATGLQSEAARALPSNGMADALPFFEALARGPDASGTPLVLALSDTLSLRLTLG